VASSTGDLERAVQEAYKHYALQLMFNGQESIADQWTNPNITGAVPRPILLSGGGVPTSLVLICLLVWALGCLGLGLAYGARKRWADKFNGYSFHQYCTVHQIDLDLIFKPAF
jgi:hypothetical protein